MWEEVAFSGHVSHGPRSHRRDALAWLLPAPQEPPPPDKASAHRTRPLSLRYHKSREVHGRQQRCSTDLRASAPSCLPASAPPWRVSTLGRHGGHDRKQTEVCPLGTDGK